jgi:hypothetical protein
MTNIDDQSIGLYEEDGTRGVLRFPWRDDPAQVRPWSTDPFLCGEIIEPKCWNDC